MKTLEYEFEVTTFAPELRHERFSCNLPQAMEALCSLPGANAVIFVAALGDRVDYGNFYCFLNDRGAAHVMLHEHCEVYAKDPAWMSQDEECAFLNEDGARFVVDDYLITSRVRAMEALKYWLPDQDHWPELEWRYSQRRDAT